jgi:hypothetical protein
MRVTTPAIKLDVELETAEVTAGEIRFTGMAGMMPCETQLSPREAWSLVRLCLRPHILWLLLSAPFARRP